MLRHGTHPVERSSTPGARPIARTAHRGGAITVLLAAGVMCALAPGCRATPTEAAGEPPPSPLIVGPELYARIDRQVVRGGPRIEGSLEARHRAVLRAEVGGPVQAVLAELGERVRRGQVLARIQAPDLGDAVLSAESAVRALEHEVQVAARQQERTEAMVRAGGLAEHDLEAAESTSLAARSRLEEARARRRLAEKQRRHAVITAPIDGVVSATEVHQGDVVALGAPLFTIVDPTSMELAGSVTTDDVAALALGAPVEFSVRGYPGQTFNGRIARIAPAADPATRQVPVLVSIPNPGGRLLAGLFAEGWVELARREVAAIPTGALDPRTSTVLRVTGGRSERVAVEAGLRDDRAGRVEVLSGLAAGEVVLVGPAAQIAPGTAIELRGPDPGEGRAAAEAIARPGG